MECLILYLLTFDNPIGTVGRPEWIVGHPESPTVDMSDKGIPVSVVEFLWPCGAESSSVLVRCPSVAPLRTRISRSLHRRHVKTFYDCTSCFVNLNLSPLAVISFGGRSLMNYPSNSKFYDLFLYYSWTL